MEEICGNCENWEEDDKKNRTGRCNKSFSLKPDIEDFIPLTPSEPDTKATDHCHIKQFKPRL